LCRRGATSAVSKIELKTSHAQQPVVMTSPKRRFQEIDALRGIAAATVVLWHSLLIFPSVGGAETRGAGLTWLNVAKYSPLRALFAGPPAVLLFFVISGFVLALPFFRSVKPRYSAFLVRRFARIWPAYAFACGLAFVAATSISSAPIPGLSPWFNRQWQHPITDRLLEQHLVLVDNFDSGAVDPVFWSLVHEMRVSIVFPLLLAVVAWRRRWRLTIAATVVGTLAFAQLTPNVFDVGYDVTLRYLGFFVAGILLAQHRDAVLDRYRSLSSAGRASVGLIALLLYTYPFWMPTAHHLDDVSSGAGSVGFLVVALGSRRAGRLLCTRPLQFLGRISYSLYLVHVVLVLSLVHLLYGRLQTILILFAIWTGSLALAALSERYVERPGIRIGRHLSRQFSRATPEMPAPKGRSA
jgi:peptidoglycan/LPS O-acetylase OafA/YrhL